MLMEERLNPSFSHESDSFILLSEDPTEYNIDELATIRSWSSRDLIPKDDYDMIGILSSAIEQVTVQIKEVKDEIKMLLPAKWTSIAKDRLRRQKILLEVRRAMIQDRLLNQYTVIQTRMHRDAKTVRLRDKMSFVVGVVFSYLI
ncbi:hypothetical protein INT46_002753 [Mucor plumbeus]|uniref:Uncharacterized protein n=1 Tax=Mucor plumbeus TaxID=97098 RepID=A0A8H7RPR5_9FUNG|nr:hypothetical protein INT46_002753 [Mucor plumbeus]